MLVRMVRPSLLALVLALGSLVAPAGCTPRAVAEVELARPLRWMPVDDPGGALAAVVAAVGTDPAAGLGVDERIVGGGGHRPDIRETFVTGPEKHVLKDFILRHPGLAPPPGHRFGYEREVDRDGAPRWRLHCLRDVGFEVARVASAAVEEDMLDGTPRIRIHLGSEQAAAFARLTTDNLGARLALVHDDEVLMAPVVMEPLTGGAFSITLGEARTRTETEAELARLLGR